MDILTLLKIDRFYKNNGQEAERVFRYTYEGILKRADNLKHTDGADCDNIQIKSARASVCTGTNIEEYLKNDKAERFAYVIADFSIAYIMTKALYIEFVKTFGTVTRESDKNGGGVKLRLKSESKVLLQWLRERAQALS